MNENPFYSPLFLVNKNLCTKFENEFFNLIDHFDITIYFDSKEFSFENLEIYRAFSSFRQEIIDNITLFGTEQKISYLNRLLERLNQSSSKCLNESNKGIRIFLEGEEFTPVSDINAYFRIMRRKKNKLTDFIESLMKSSLPIGKKGNHSCQSELKPIFNHDLLPCLIDILQQFFSIEHRVLLTPLLATGDDSPEPLIFLGYGNRLADAFKQLYIAGIITGCDKKDLEDWIMRNFRFISHHHPSDFSHYYLNRIISTKDDSCRNPIIDIYKDHDTGKFSIKGI